MGNKCKAHSCTSTMIYWSYLFRCHTATDNIFSKHTLQWLTTIVHSTDQVLAT